MDWERVPNYSYLNLFFPLTTKSHNTFCARPPPGHTLLPLLALVPPNMALLCRCTCCDLSMVWGVVIFKSPPRISLLKGDMTSPGVRCIGARVRRGEPLWGDTATNYRHTRHCLRSPFHRPSSCPLLKKGTGPKDVCVGKSSQKRSDTISSS